MHISATHCLFQDRVGTSQSSPDSNLILPCLQRITFPNTAKTNLQTGLNQGFYQRIPQKIRRSRDNIFKLFSPCPSPRGPTLERSDLVSYSYTLCSRVLVKKVIPKTADVGNRHKVKLFSRPCCCLCRLAFPARLHLLFSRIDEQMFDSGNVCMSSFTTSPKDGSIRSDTRWSQSELN